MFSFQQNTVNDSMDYPGKYCQLMSWLRPVGLSEETSFGR